MTSPTDAAGSPSAAPRPSRIDRLLAAGPTWSLEFFPPKTAKGVAQLEAAMVDLDAADPSFVSVTYGAGGSTRDHTRDLTVRINGTRPYPAMPHLTCIGHTRPDLKTLVDDYASQGVENILALAGDPPADGSPAVGDFTYASELVRLLRDQGDYCVGVAAFPEGHPRSPSLAQDRRRLAEKLEEADFAITQFFFDADHYVRLVDDLAALGCTKPVLPGVIPLLEPTTIARFAQMNGTTFPEDLAARVETADPGDRLGIAVDAAVELCRKLIAGGVPGLHLYCLNRSEAALAILEALGDRAGWLPRR